MSNYTGAVPDWQAHAACRGLGNDVMYPSNNAREINAAKAYCRRCPALDACRQWALDTRELHGVLGGLTEDERWDLLRQTSRLTRRPAAQERGPKKPPPRTIRELFDRHANPSTGGHLMWIGAKTPIFRGRQFTPGKVAFIADRGREPKGMVKRLCEVSGCVQPLHLADERERSRRQVKAAV